MFIIVKLPIPVRPEASPEYSRKTCFLMLLTFSGVLIAVAEWDNAITTAPVKCEATFIGITRLFCAVEVLETAHVK